MNRFPRNDPKQAASYIMYNNASGFKDVEKVAGSGFEPPIYGLWARRDLLATPPRYTDNGDKRSVSYE